MLNVKKPSSEWDKAHEEAANRILVGMDFETVVPDYVVVWAWQEMQLMQQHIDEQNKLIKELRGEPQSSSEDM